MTLWTEDLKALHNLFANAGFEIRIVGGAVRDYLMHVESNDVDLCTDATPDEMIELANVAGIKVIPTGLQHGTVSFVINGEPYEITTLRVDVETDGRHAEVEFTRSFEEDAKRRDFTINAMSIDIDGNVYDYFDGQTDLANHAIRFVGEAEDRIREDFLRVMRWYRFYSRMGYEPSASNPQPFFSSYQKLFSKQWVLDGLKGVSGERIWAEFKKITLGANMTSALPLLEDSGLLGSVLGGLITTSSNPVNVDVSLHKTLEMLETLLASKYRDIQEFQEYTPLLILAQVLVLNEPDKIDVAFERLKLSSKEQRVTRFFVHFINVQVPLGVGNSRIIGHNDRPVMFTLASAWAKYQASMGEDLHACALLVSCTDELFFHSNTLGTMEAIFDIDGSEFVSGCEPFALTGKDLIDRGLKPGPSFKHLLDYVRFEWYTSVCTMNRFKQLAVLDRLLFDTREPTVLVKTVHDLRRGGDSYYDYYRKENESKEWAMGFERETFVVDRRSRDTYRIYVVCKSKQEAVKIKLEESFLNDATIF